MIKLALVIVLLLSGSIALPQSITHFPAPDSSQYLKLNRPVQRELHASQTHTYQITLSKGQFLSGAVSQHGIDVIVRIFSPNGVEISEIDSPNGEFEDEPIAIKAKAAGLYRIDIQALEKNTRPGRYVITINEILSAKEYATRQAEMLRKYKAVVGWLKTNAIPLKTVEAGTDVADLQPLKQVFKNVRFVGLGEETHGTREFFQVKHRLLEFLVREMNFRVFAIEASYAALQLINDYVMGRLDDGTKALDSQGFWIWNTAEVRALMNWARTYNAGVSADSRVKFVGFDIQYNQPGKDKLLDYLKRVAPQRVPMTEAFFKTDLDSLNSVLSKTPQQKTMQDSLKLLGINYAELQQFIDKDSADLVAKSSQTEYEQMREYSRVLNQYIDSYSRQDTVGSAARDVYMADNFRRLVDREPVGTRFVIWAHNGHVATANNGFFKPMGAYLQQFYGTDYYGLGLSFNRGSFQAREAQPADSAKRMLLSFTVPSALPGSVDWYLTQTKLKTFVVDFRATIKNTDITNWLATPLPMRSIGSVYQSGAEQNFFYPVTLSQRFDGLLFIDTTTRARPNPSVKNVAGRDDK